MFTFLPDADGWLQTPLAAATLTAPKASFAAPGIPYYKYGAMKAYPGL